MMDEGVAIGAGRAHRVLRKDHAAARAARSGEDGL